MSSNTSGEGEIRKNIIEKNLVDCMIALPGQLFYNTPPFQPVSGSLPAIKRTAVFGIGAGKFSSSIPGTWEF
jgi:hypothetical protein